MTIWNGLPGAATRELSGTSCKVCGSPIARADEFGASEAVCRPCRAEANRSWHHPAATPESAARLTPDPAFAAVRHILTAPAIAPRTARFIRADGFDWFGLFVEADRMSSGQSALVRVAFDVWEGTGDVDLWELVRTLDERSLQRVLDGLRIARGELEAEEWELPAAA